MSSGALGDRPAHHLALAAAGSALLCAALYGGVLRGRFVYDDLSLLEDPRLHPVRLSQVGEILAAPGVPRRLGLATFALNSYLGGADPRGYHLVNVAVHALNGTLLFALAFRLLTLAGGADRRGAALSAALGSALWVAHPIQTQAVSYVYQRYTSLCASFYLATLILHVEARRRSGWPRLACHAGSAISALSALMIKENAATLPLFVLLIELFFLQQRPLRLDARRLALALAVFLSLGLIAGYFLGPHAWEMMARDYARRGFTMTERLLTEVRVVWLYVGLLALPHPSRLKLDYDFPISNSLVSPPTTGLCLLLLIGSVGAAAVQAKRRPLLAFAVFWFFGQLVVESTFVPLDLVYEHRLYLPSMLPLLLVPAGLARLTRSTRLAAASVMALLAVAGAWTVQRNGVWRDPVALWTDNAAKSPRKARVHVNLGKALLERGRHEEARAALERALALGAGSLEAEASNNLAVAHLEAGRFDEARRVLLELLDRRPFYAPAWLNIGVVDLRSGDSRDAAEELERALALDSRRPHGFYNLAAAHLQLGEPARARAVLERGLGVWPQSAELHALLAVSCIEAGDLARGRTALAEALRLDPQNAVAARYLARVGGDAG